MVTQHFLPSILPPVPSSPRSAADGGSCIPFLAPSLVPLTCQLKNKDNFCHLRVSLKTVATLKSSSTHVVSSFFFSRIRFHPTFCCQGRSSEVTGSDSLSPLKRRADGAGLWFSLITASPEMELSIMVTWTSAEGNNRLWPREPMITINAKTRQRDPMEGHADRQRDHMTMLMTAQGAAQSLRHVIDLNICNNDV